MQVNLVTGASHSGKSTFVHEVIGERDLYIDVLDMQALFQLKDIDNGDSEVAATMTATSAAFEIQRRKHNVAFIEFPGLTKYERAIYLQKLFPVMQDTDLVVLHWFVTSPEVRQLRLENDAWQPRDFAQIVAYQDSLIELPEEAEGFDKVVYHHSEQVESLEVQLRHQVHMHLSKDIDDPTEAARRLHEWHMGKCDVLSYSHVGNKVLRFAYEWKGRL